MPDNAFTADELHGQTEEMTFAGALSFLRRKYTKDLTGAEVAITGLPFDSATSNRPGARMGPAAIRAASVQLAELKAFPSGLNLYQELAIVDYGDCYLDYGYPENVVDSIIEHTRTILAADVMAVSLGGDHFVTYPLLRAHFEKYGPLSLLHFDAHCDTWPDDGKRLDHGSMFTRAVADGLIVPEESVQVGLRTHNDKTLGFHILDAPWNTCTKQGSTPRSIAFAVANDALTNAIRKLNNAASMSCSFSNRTPYQRRENPVHTEERLESLNENAMSTMMGRYRNA